MTGGKKTVVCPLGLLRIAFWLISMGVACGFSTAGESPKDRLAKAEAMFQERCKTAGEKIYRTAENVEGVLLMKIRPGETNYRDQFRLHDPYGHDSTKDEYIKSFLYGRDSNGSLAQPDRATRLGYRYVEFIDPADGKKYRYTASIKDMTHVSSIMMGGDGKTTFVTKDFVLDKTPAAGAPVRYGVTYADISTRVEREYWIAGSSLKVIELKTNEVMAERIGYLMDRGQGNTSGGRSPWLLAASHACPKFPTNGGSTDQVNQSRNFVEKILHIKQEK